MWADIHNSINSKVSQDDDTKHNSLEGPTKVTVLLKNPINVQDNIIWELNSSHHILLGMAISLQCYKHLNNSNFTTTFLKLTSETKVKKMNSGKS
jgi:hypothetical protein